MNLGKMYTSGQSFRARAEARQRRYRAEVLKAGHGTYGHVLGEEAAEAGLNFLTVAARDAVVEREAKGKGVDHKRTWGNLLSSQAMCFNLFGPLAKSEEGRRALAETLAAYGLPVTRVQSVDIEYTPPPEVFLDQSTVGGVDCDVLVHFTSPAGPDGVLVIETKFVETEFSKCSLRHRPATRLNKKTDQHEPTDRCPEGTVAGCRGQGCRYQSKKGYRYWEQSAAHGTLKDEVYEEACLPVAAVDEPHAGARSQAEQELSRPVRRPRFFGQQGLACHE